MADNVLIPNDGDATAATDEVGDVHYQKVKLVDGTADSTTVIPAKTSQPGASDAGLVVREAARGQAAMAASIPVAVASNQSAIPVSGTVTANAGSGTLAVSAASLPLPSGAATGAKQDTGNTSLASIDGKITAVDTG